jgi:uncharacterized membrane protein
MAVDQNTVIGAVAGAIAGAIISKYGMKKKSSNQKIALVAAAGAAAVGGATYMYGQRQSAQAATVSSAPVKGMDDVGMIVPLIGEVDLVKSGAGAFAGFALGTAFGNPVIGTAVGAAATTALSKWNAA